MKNYIVTITKALNKKHKIQIQATSKKQVIERLSIHFGYGIAPINNKHIVLKTQLPVVEQSFYYENYI